MLINWFTVIAQALNFLILVWLMKHFLYKPILHAIDEREKRINAQLADAQKKESDAQKEKDEFQKKNKEFDGQRTELLKQATAAAQVERDRLLTEAKRAALELSSQRQKALQKAELNLNQAIARKTQLEVFAIARKALTDLADASLEKRMIGVFVRRLRKLSEGETEQLVSELKASKDPLIIRTTFPLSAAQRIAAKSAVKTSLGAHAHIEFETSPDLVSGIELVANGQKVSWTIAEYLATLEKSIADLLQTRGNSTTAPKVATKDNVPRHEAMSQ